MTLFFKERWQGIEASVCVWISVMTRHIMRSICLTVLKQPLLTQACQNQNVTDPCTCNCIPHNTASHFSAVFILHLEGPHLQVQDLEDRLRDTCPFGRPETKALKTILSAKWKRHCFYPFGHRTKAGVLEKIKEPGFCHSCSSILFPHFPSATRPE